MASSSACCFLRSANPSHVLNVTTQAMDVGALTPPLWVLRTRESHGVLRARPECRIRGIFRFGGVHQDLPRKLVEAIQAWAIHLSRSWTS